MLAVRLHPEGLRIDEIETPSAGTGAVLVRVHAAAITRDELEWPTDRLPAIVSYELSGVVVDTGEEVFALTPFDRRRSLVAVPWPLVVDYIGRIAIELGADRVPFALRKGSTHRGDLADRSRLSLAAWLTFE